MKLGKKTIIIILVFIYISALGLYMLKNIPIIDKNIIQGKNEINLGEIKDNVEIEQTYLCEEDGLEALGLCFGTFQRNNKNKLQVIIKDNYNNTVYNETIDASSLKDNDAYFFRFNKIPNSKGHIYTIHINTIGATEGNTITLWASKLDDYKEGTLIINGVKQNNDVSLQSISSNLNKFTKINKMLSHISVNKMKIVVVFITLCISLLYYLYVFLISIIQTSN